MGGFVNPCRYEKWCIPNIRSSRIYEVYMPATYRMDTTKQKGSGAEKQNRWSRKNLFQLVSFFQDQT
jgi:hypothetical protein